MKKFFYKIDQNKTKVDVILCCRGFIMRLMKKSKVRADYMAIIKYLLLFCGFLIAEAVKDGVPCGAALNVAALILGGNPLIIPPLYILSLTVLGRMRMLIPMAAFSVLLSAVIAVYNTRNSKPRYELFIYILVGLIPYIVLYTELTLLYRIASALSVTALSVIVTVCGGNSGRSALTKPEFFEIICTFICVALAGLGISNICGAEIWKTVAVFTMLIALSVYGAGAGIVVSAMLGCGLCLYYKSPTYLGVFVMYAVFALTFINTNRYAGAAAVLLSDAFCGFLLNVYPDYSYYSIALTFGACLLYSIIPKKRINKLKDRLYLYKENQLVRQTINRNRTLISDRLFEISGVFTEIGNIFLTFKKAYGDAEKSKKLIARKLTDNACKECAHRDECRINSAPFRENVAKFTEIGFAKGKVTFIDVPKLISDRCKNLSGLLFCLNKLLAEHRAQVIESMNAESGRELIGNQAFGIAEVLRGLAMENCKVLKYRSDAETEITDALNKRGVSVSECLVYGDGEDVVINVIFMGNYPVEEIQNVVGERMGLQLTVTENYSLGADKFCMILKKAPEYDAVFGIAHEKKDGSEKSGDTHSVIRISDQKFMVALCDGMGSGEKAENVSDLSLSLIESFYKSGMNSRLILQTVNKVLAVNTDDTFSAMDISVIDLSAHTADFIKYGAPYGFIINDQGIRMIEGNSLPMGILTDLEPTVNSATVADGDMLLFVTDGISDAFGSSSEMIDYLQTTTAKNPQTLAEIILGRALTLTGGERRDDMSALAVRIFKRNSEQKNSA